MAYYVFEDQTNIRIRFTGCGDLTSNTECLIKYGTVDDNNIITYIGSWTATVEGAVTAGIIYYDLDYEDGLPAGKYTFWPHITFSDGTMSIGKAVRQTIKEEGEWV